MTKVTKNCQLCPLGKFIGQKGYLREHNNQIMEILIAWALKIKLLVLVKNL
jgi:hypothetical protein